MQKLTREREDIMETLIGSFALLVLEIGAIALLIAAWKKMR